MNVLEHTRGLKHQKTRGLLSLWFDGKRKLEQGIIIYDARTTKQNIPIGPNTDSNNTSENICKQIHQIILIHFFVNILCACDEDTRTPMY